MLYLECKINKHSLHSIAGEPYSWLDDDRVKAQMTEIAEMSQKVSKMKNKTLFYFKMLKKEFDNVDEFILEELKDDIESERVRHFGFANFYQNDKFYTCDLLSKNFTKQDKNYLVFQEEYMYDSFRGYLAYPLKKGGYWIVSFEE